MIRILLLSLLLSVVGCRHETEGTPPKTKRAEPAFNPYNAVDKKIISFRNTPFRLPAPSTSSEALRNWQSKAREALMAELDIRTASRKVPLDLRILEETPGNGFRRIKVDYRLDSSLRTPAYLYYPTEGKSPYPVILLWHGHHEMGKDSLAVENGPLHGVTAFDAAPVLARAGFVVMTPDIRSFGETGGITQHFHLSQLHFLEGRPLMGVFLSDAWRALDVIEQTQGLDLKRIGVAGFSLGGEITLLTAATDPRVKVSAVQGFLCSARGNLLFRTHCMCNYFPLLGNVMDISDVALLTAPSPLCFVMGRNDPGMPWKEVETTFQKIQSGYQLLGKEESVSLFSHPGGHEWINTDVLPWFKKNL